MATTKASKNRAVRVLISHDALEAGEVFDVTNDNIGWVQPRVDAGYLEYIDSRRDVLPGEIVEDLPSPDEPREVATTVVEKTRANDSKS